MSNHSILDYKIGRRSLIKKGVQLGSLGVVASAVSLPFQANKLAFAQSSESENDVKIKYSACLVNCGSRCPLRVHVKNDVIIKIDSEPGEQEGVWGKQQIRPCLRGRSMRWRVYNPDRLKYPMLRVGKRGEGKFKQITWDEATTLIAEKLKYTIEKYGNEAIYYHLGTGNNGANLHGRNTCKRFLSAAGGFLDQHGTYSEAQMNTIQPYLFGQSKNIYGAEQQTLFSEIKNSDLVVMFGQNIAETRQSGGGQVVELFEALEQSKAKVIIIDPRMNDSVIAYDAQWIPIRPGTDAALVAGIIHTLIKEDRIDEAMLAKYSVGWSDDSLPASAPKHASYKSYILGLGEDKTEKTAQWASKLTGIPVKRIIQLAREIANAKAAWVSQGWGLQRTQNGEHASRAIMALPIVTGHFGRSGTNIGTWGGSVPYSVPGIGMANPVKVSIPTFMWTDAIFRGTEMTAARDFVKGKERLATNVKFLWNYAGNVLANQHSDLNRTHEIVVDESLCEFILVWDTHLTASAKYADLLLPDVMTLETDDLINNAYQSGAYHYLVRLQHAIKPLWENRQMYDVLVEIAEKMGGDVKDKFTLGRTYQQWIEHTYELVRKNNPHLPEFAQTDDKGVLDRKLAKSGDYIALKDFRDDPVANPLKTPSGKVELYSEALSDEIARRELLPGDILHPIPAYAAAIEGVEDHQVLAKYPLQMTGFHTKGHCHSSYANLTQLHEVAPDQVWINPIDAQQRGLKSGDLAHIFNDRGVIAMPVRVTNRIIPGVVAVPQGAWAEVDANGVDVGGCINRLTSMRPSPLAKGNGQHTNLVEIKRVDTQSH